MPKFFAENISREEAPTTVQNPKTKVLKKKENKEKKFQRLTKKKIKKNLSDCRIKIVRKFENSRI